MRFSALLAGLLLLAACSPAPGRATLPQSAAPEPSAPQAASLIAHLQVVDLEGKPLPGPLAEAVLSLLEKDSGD